MSTVEQSRKPSPRFPARIRRTDQAPRRRGLERGRRHDARVRRTPLGGIIEDVDGNRFIDLGSGIAVTTIGNRHPGGRCGARTGGRFHAHLLHGHAVRGVHRGLST